MLLYWSMLLLCLSANAENSIYREPGQSVTLKCSSAGCLNNITDYVGMYLYKGFEKENVIYYHPNPKSEDKITPGRRYKDRIQKKGSMDNHTITIRNLNLNDSGSYICVYKRFPIGDMQCNNYTVEVQVPQCPTVPPSHAPHTAASTHKPIGVNHECPFLLIIIPTAAISMLVTTIFTLLIIPRVKLWICSRMTRSTLPVSGDYVYETMSKNGLQRLAVAEHPLDSPYGIIA